MGESTPLVDRAVTETERRTKPASSAQYTRLLVAQLGGLETYVLQIKLQSEDNPELRDASSTIMQDLVEHRIDHATATARVTSLFADLPASIDFSPLAESDADSAVGEAPLKDLSIVAGASVQLAISADAAASVGASPQVERRIDHLCANVMDLYPEEPEKYARFIMLLYNLPGHVKHPTALAAMFVQLDAIVASCPPLRAELHAILSQIVKGVWSETDTAHMPKRLALLFSTFFGGCLTAGAVYASWPSPYALLLMVGIAMAFSSYHAHETLHLLKLSAPLRARMPPVKDTGVRIAQMLAASCLIWGAVAIAPDPHAQPLPVGFTLVFMGWVFLSVAHLAACAVPGPSAHAGGSSSPAARARTRLASAFATPLLLILGATVVCQPILNNFTLAVGLPIIFVAGIALQRLSAALSTDSAVPSRRFALISALIGVEMLFLGIANAVRIGSHNLPWPVGIAEMFIAGFYFSTAFFAVRAQPPALDVEAQVTSSPPDEALRAASWSVSTAFGTNTS